VQGVGVIVFCIPCHHCSIIISNIINHLGLSLAAAAAADSRLFPPLPFFVNLLYIVLLYSCAFAVLIIPI